MSFTEIIDSLQMKAQELVNISGLIKRQQQIVQLLQVEPLTRQELMEKMNAELARTELCN